MFKRIGLFLLTNILIITTISIVVSLLGVGNYIGAYGLDYGKLFAFCLVWGMVGSFISLALSRVSAKWMMGVEVIDPSRAGEFSWLVNEVQQLAKRANLPVCPEVGVYQSPEVNAFATGPTKNRALVAVSTGLLNSMSRDEISGVLAHEVAHIQNGDMVTLTLIQGVVNAFVMFFARIAAYFAGQAVKEESRAMVEFIVVIVTQIGLGILGMMVVGYFSRQREFRADKGSASLAGRENMVRALAALQRIHGAPESAAPSLAPFKITGRSSSGLAGLFSMSTHPPLEERIAALA